MVMEDADAPSVDRLASWGTCEKHRSLAVSAVSTSKEHKFHGPGLLS